MGLGLNISGNDSSGGGSFLPRMEYSAKSGRMKFTGRIEVNGTWETQEEDVSFQQPVFVADLANVMVGWLFFKKGMPPVRALVKLGEEFPPCPPGDFGIDERGNPIKPKKGFVLRLLDANRTLREFSSNAAAAATSMDMLHTMYESAPEAKEGLLPVVQFTGATELKGKHGNYTPNFAIVKWVPRPAELGAPAAPATQVVAAPVAQVAASLPPAMPQSSKPLPF